MESKRKFASKAQILQAPDLPVVELEVPEWGCWVRVRTLTAGERDNFEAEITMGNGKNARVNARNIRAKMVAATVVDEEGRPLFGLADVEALGQKSAKALDRIFGQAAALAGMREADVQELAEKFRSNPRRRLIFRLALEMGRTVRELLGSMDSHELTEWMAFDMVEPIGGRRGDYQAAVVASTVANANRGKGKRALTPNDFVPEYGGRAMATLDAWVGQRIAEKAWEQDASGETAQAGDNPDEDADGERLRRAGGELDDSAGGDGMGEMTPLLTETREKFAAQGAQIQARVSWQCRLRWCVLSPATNRLVMDGTVYEVSGVMDPDGRRHELVVLCWEVQA